MCEMITDIDVLYNRHLLSRHQINTHFGFVDNTHPFQNEGIFQTVKAFSQIVDALQAEMIDFIPLKGPVLSDLLYQDCSCRRFYDLDFVVDFEDVERFSNLLADLGYHPTKKWPVTPHKKEALRLHTNQYLFEHRQNGTDVEIHWRLFTHYRFPDISFPKLYQDHTTPYTMNGRCLRKLSNELELLFLLIHGATHTWYRLKWLVDVNDYIRNVAVDFDVLHDMAANNGFLRMLAYYNAIAKTYIPNACTIPGEKDGIPHYVRRHTDKEMREEPLKKEDLPIGRKRNTLDVTDRYLTANYLAPDFFSRCIATKYFISGLLPRKLILLLKPIDPPLSYAIKKPFFRRAA